MHSDSDSSDGEEGGSVQKVINCEEWFVRLTGYSESDWRRKSDKGIRQAEDGSLIITNLKNKKTFSAGTFTLQRLGDLINEVQASAPIRGYVPPCILEIVTRADSASIRNVDVAHLQAMPENRHAVFQVASNFNGVEAISEGSSPDGSSFTEKYIYDLTQGPAASISAGAAAITRVHAAFYDPTKPQGEWTQTATRQVNFLADLRKHFPTHNGYVVLTGREPSFPKVGSAKYDRLFGKVLVGYHHNVQVTTGHRHRGFDVVDDPKQVVDQVFCAALNIGQGMSGMTNKRVSHSQEKCQFILDSDYEATYLSAIKHKRKHLVLTLIGGGVFGNSKQGIYEAILKAHKKWANHPASQLEKVSIVLFSDRDFMTSFPSILKQQNVPFRWTNYVHGSPMTKDSHGITW